MTEQAKEMLEMAAEHAAGFNGELTLAEAFAVAITDAFSRLAK